MRRILSVLAAALLLSSCSFLGLGGEPEITGSYELTATLQGQSIPASMRIVREDGSYSGWIEADMSSFTIGSVTRRDHGGWLVRASGMEGGLEMILMLEEENRVSGTWRMGSSGGDFIGEKVEG